MPNMLVDSSKPNTFGADARVGAHADTKTTATAITTPARQSPEI